MNEYKFALNIYDSTHEISPTNGIDWGELADIIDPLAEATDPKDGSKCTLIAINNHGYTPVFQTESQVRYDRFLSVHHHIHDRSLQDLKPIEAKYARALKKMLSKNRFLEPLDKDFQPIVKLSSAQIEQTVDHYFRVTDIEGIISEIGAPALTWQTHISVHGVDYKIYTTQDYDSELQPFYRKRKLRFKVKQKISVISGHVISAQLISFSPKSQKSIIESLESLSKDELNIFQGVHSHEELLNLLRS